MNHREVAFTGLISSTRVSRNLLSQLLPPLIPVLTVALAYPLWQLGLLVSVFTFGSGVGQAPVGHLADRYDRQYLLPTGFVLGGASYLLFASAPRLGELTPGLTVGSFDAKFLVMCVAMFFVGVGMSVVHPTAYPLITENVRDSNKGKVYGIFGSAAKVGGALIPLVVGVLILTLAWDEIVATLGAFGLVYGSVLFVVLRRFETRPVNARDEGGDERVDGDELEGSADASDRREYVYPLVVIYLFFITRAFAGKGLRTFLPAFIVGAYAYTFSVLDQTLAPESVANFYLSVLLFVGAGTQVVLGWILDRYDPRKALVLFMFGATGGIAVLAYSSLAPLGLLAVLVVIGAGIWGLNPARDMLISDITPPDREGRTFGYLWTASSLTSALIPTVVGYVADVFGLRQSFGILAFGTLLAGCSILLLYSDRIYVRAPTDAVKQQSGD